MNAISLTRHLLLKGLRHQRGWLALLWLIALLLPFAAPFVAAPNSGPGNAFVVATAGFVLLLCLVPVLLIRLDPPGWEFHFLATRPVSWKALLTSKFLFICLFLLLPVWVVKLGVIWLLKIPINLVDVALLLAECTICVGAVLAVATLLALFLRSVPAIFVSMIALAALYRFAAALMDRRYFHSGFISPMPDYALIDCRRLVFYIGIIATACLVAFFRYRRKSVLAPLCILLVGLALSAAAWIYWPWDLGRFFPNKPDNTGELPSPMRNQIKLTLTGGEGRGGNDIENFGTAHGTECMVFNHETTLEGVKPPYFAKLVDYHAVATLKSGRAIRSAYHDVDVHGGTGGILTTDVEAVLTGFTREGDPVQGGQGSAGQFEQFEIFNYLPDHYQNEDLTGASIKGVLTLEIRRAFIVKTMPLKTGGTFDMPRRHYVLEDVEFKQGIARYRIRANMTPSTFRGDSDWNYWESGATWVVFNRGRREYFEMSGGGMSGASEIFYSFQLLEQTLRREDVERDEQREEEPIPAEWADTTEINIFSSEPCGRIDLPYEIKSVDLKH